ncbi:MAG: class I SAM-dependent methyltransferase [Lachnospiraceae bacterium]
MKEKIGEVILDGTYYPGEDLYSDGVIEDRILELVSTHTTEEYNELIAQSKDWAILYHLSHLRGNIVDWLPIGSGDTVLEVGSGCGAVTGALSAMAQKVTCIELSKKRSLINANRNAKCSNIEILLGNFEEVEPHLPQRYDWITLIGVFEYARGYIHTEDPYVDFIKTMKRHLTPGGKIVIAIENRLGLKYFAGCTEDHTGVLFEGIEGYRDETLVRTFSKPELEAMMQRAGFDNYTFYYPYPDYKLPLSIYSDEYLPTPGDLRNNQNNFDRRRLQLFDEASAFDSIINSGLFPVFSNSFLVVLEGEA